MIDLENTSLDWPRTILEMSLYVALRRENNEYDMDGGERSHLPAIGAISNTSTDKEYSAL